ncbi:voltage-gated purine nucleotide uniporter SLC17A9-like [Amphiura filiformis]|uniref:voltage-gated purine nucleotide uniporter SLC17A9-like n=1 Tax=Amphiura filiformis TaxID=82378 RepID=UPI003B216BF0
MSLSSNGGNIKLTTAVPAGAVETASESGAEDLNHEDKVDHEDETKVPLLHYELVPKVVKDGICLQPQSSPSKEAEPIYWNSDEQKQWIALLFVGTTMAYATRTILPLCAVTVADEFGWDKTDMGLVLGCFFWGYPVFQIMGGHISDRIGGDQVLYRAAFVWSSICMITPYAAYVYQSKAATVYMMALLRFLMGLTQGVHFPSLTSLISSRVKPSQKALVLTISFTASSVGSVFSGGIGSILLGEFHWSTLFYVFGAIAFMWAVCLLNSQQKNTENQLDRQVVLTGLTMALCYRGLLLAYLLHSYVFLVLFNWLPTFFTECFPGHKGWVFNVLPWLVQIPTSIASGILAGKLTDRGYETGVARKIVYTICASGMVTSLVAVSLTSTYSTALFLMVSAIGWSAFSNGALPVNIQDIAPNQAGAVYGILNTVGALQGFIGSYITGYILHLTESWATVFCSTSTVLAFGWIVFVLFGSGKPIL